jgi:hypothetical protein
MDVILSFLQFQFQFYLVAPPFRRVDFSGPCYVGGTHLVSTGAAQMRK